MREFVIYFNFAHIRRVAGHDVVWNVYNEIDDDGLLVAFLPVFQDDLLLLVQFFHLSANVEASYVIIVLGTAEGLESRKIFFDV